MSNPYLNYVSVSFSEALIGAVNAAAATNPQVKQFLEELEGKRVGVQVSDLRYSIAITVNDNWVELVDQSIHTELDLLLKGTTANFLRVTASREMDTSALEYIEIVGDVQLAYRLYKILKNINFDWEEEVSKRIGDIPARQIGNVFRWCKFNLTAVDSPVKRNIRNTLINKTHIMPKRSRVEEFVDSVDDLQADIDRLEKRIDRLSK